MARRGWFSRILALVAIAVVALLVPAAPAHAESGYVRTATTSFALKTGTSVNGPCVGYAWLGYTDTGTIETETWLSCTGNVQYIKNVQTDVTSPRMHVIKTRHNYCGLTRGGCSVVASVANATRGREYCSQGLASVTAMATYSGVGVVCFKI